MRWTHAQLTEAHRLVRGENKTQAEAARILTERWGKPITRRQTSHAVEQFERSSDGPTGRWTDEQLAEMWRLFRVDGHSARQTSDILNKRWGLTDITRSTVLGAVNRYELRTGLRAKRPEERGGRVFAPIPNTYTARNGVTLAARVL